MPTTCAGDASGRDGTAVEGRPRAALRRHCDAASKGFGAIVRDVRAPLTVLVIDDDAAIRTMLDLALREAGFTVLLNDGRAVRETDDADVALLDIRLGNRTARDLLDESPALGSIPIILMTATTGLVTAARMFPEARATLRKPFDLDDLERTIREVAAAPAPRGA